ncbi:MAG: guanylate kinase [Planctomycetota bacterium]|jgi:guanylate kinase
MADEGGAERLVDPGRVYVLSGPSGVGKNTIASRLCQRGGAARAVTATTRPPRAGEVDGRDYHFVDEEQFLRWIREGRLLEHTKYVDHYYGTPLASVNRAAAEGLPVLLTIDVDGALQMKRRWPEVTLIFVEPPSGEELQRRLRARRRDDTVDISQRLRRAREECEYADQYDFRVVNDDLEGAVQEVARIVAGRSQRQRQDS